jgi:hypothetical protein
MVTMRYPDGLGKAGRGLWRGVMADYELSAVERMTLEQACRTVDLLGRVDVELTGDVTCEGSMGQVRVHPLLRSRTELCTLLDAQLRGLALPMPDEEAGQRRSPAAVAAAQARWRQGARGG